MLNRKIDRYLQDFISNSQNALLITGARQIGKTYSIRELGKQFKSFIEINFIETPDAVELFSGAKNSEDILLRLSALTSKPLIKGETLIFFDEVQCCPDIVTAIKFLVEEGSYRYILSGSLLGVELHDLRSEPVGYMGVKEMFPLDFEEFITNLGVNSEVIAAIKRAWTTRQPVDGFIHKKLMELFRLYLIIGGMPAAVNSYIESNNLQNVTAIQQDILRMYKRDIAQYDKANKLYINEIFDLIPPELNAKNKRFILKSLNENAKLSRYENSFLWLKDAGVAIPVYNIEEPKAPLLLARSRNLFKLFQNDIGLLAAQYANGIQLKIISGANDINYGAIYENAVAQELIAHGITPYYYNNKKRGEVDFIVEINGKVVPIEVKSGKDYTSHRALSNILACDEYDLPEAIVLNNDNFKVEGKITYAPVYMTMFLKEELQAPTIYKVDISGLQ
jgi:predicted AAA+ superfamily ATPase